MYEPILTVYSVGILLVTAIVFHIATFHKSRKFIHVMFSILVSEYVSAVVMELFGIYGHFNGLLIFAVSLSILFVISLFIRKYWYSILDVNQSSDVAIYTIFCVLLFALYLFTLQKNTFPPFMGDSYIAYLPWAKTIAVSSYIPAYDINSSFYVVSYPHLAYTKIAFLYSFFDSYSESISSAMPLFYAALSIFLILEWAKERSIKPVFVIIPLLFSLSFLYIGRAVLQEPPLLLFVTSSFYFLYRYVQSNEKDVVSLIMLSISCSLVALTKYSGLLLVLIVFALLTVLLKYRHIQKKHIPIFVLLQLPWIVWMLRNLHIYGNPVFPLYTSFFPPNHLTIALHNYGQYMSMYTTPTSIPLATVQEFLLSTLIGFPLIVFTLLYFVKNRKDFEVKFFTIFFLAYFATLTFTGRYLERYFFPFYGIFALYAGIEISKICDFIPFRVIREKKSAILGLLLLCFAMFTVVLWAPGDFSHEMASGNVSYVASSFDPRKHVEPWVDFKNQTEVYSYLKSNENRTGLRIYGDGNYILYWYGNYTVIDPGSITWVTMVNGSLDYNRDSDYLYRELTKRKIDYIYDSPLQKQEWKDNLYIKINEDKEHFDLVYDKDGYRLWKVIR